MPLPVPSFVSVSFGASSTGPFNPITITLTNPGNVLPGDFLLAAITTTGSAFTNVDVVPSGWIPIQNDLCDNNNENLFTYFKIAGAAEPANYSWTLNRSVFGWVGFLTALRGAGGVNAYSVNTSNGFPHTVTTTVPNCLIVCLSAVDWPQTDHFNSASDVILSGHERLSVPGSDNTFLSGDFPLASPGATSAQTVDFGSPGQTTGIALQIAVYPAAPQAGGHGRPNQPPQHYRINWPIQTN